MNWEQVVQIQQLVNGYVRAPDEKDFDAGHLRRILTDDARVIRPNGAAMIGPETQHIISSHDGATDGDAATLGANLVAIHIWPGARTMLTNAESYFAPGGVVIARVRVKAGAFPK